jgi:hypothetical protein
MRGVTTTATWNVLVPRIGVERAGFHPHKPTVEMIFCLCSLVFLCVSSMTEIDHGGGMAGRSFTDLSPMSRKVTLDQGTERHDVYKKKKGTSLRRKNLEHPVLPNVPEINLRAME